MAINRLFLGPYNAKILGEEIKEKDEKIFDEILQDEHEQLIHLVTKMEKKWNTENLCRKYDLKSSCKTSPKK